MKSLPYSIVADNKTLQPVSCWASPFTFSITMLSSREVTFLHPYPPTFSLLFLWTQSVLLEFWLSRFSKVQCPRSPLSLAARACLGAECASIIVKGAVGSGSREWQSIGMVPWSATSGYRRKWTGGFRIHIEYRDLNYPSAWSFVRVDLDWTWRARLDAAVSSKGEL